MLHTSDGSRNSEGEERLDLNVFTQLPFEKKVAKRKKKKKWP